MTTEPMDPNRIEQPLTVDAALRLPLAFLRSYLFFLTRRPISTSNPHFLERRVVALKSLAALLANTAQPSIAQVREKLGGLNAASFHRLAPELLALLKPFAPPDDGCLPISHVFSHAAPGPSPLMIARHLLLAMGPAIGIGDEIMFFRVPQWIKRGNPNAKITVLSAYDGLWDRVVHVDQVVRYQDYPTLISALRRAPPFETVDTTIFADFENPRFFDAICIDEAIDHYIEISIAARSAVFVDNARRWLHMGPPAGPYGDNYYFALRAVFDWLGAKGDALRSHDVIAHEYPKNGETLRIFVSPFTSKYDPSEIYWSRLLAGILERLEGRPLEVRLDSGANGATARFANCLRRSIHAHTSGSSTVTVSHSSGQRTLQLKDVFDEMARASVVICADSFAAHAAPLMDCTTVTVAAHGLKRWRVPHPRSFYLSAEALPSNNAALIAELLLVQRGPTATSKDFAMLLQTAEPLLQAGERLRARLKVRGGPEALAAACHHFTNTCAEFFRHMPCGSELLNAFVADLGELPALPSFEHALWSDEQRFSELCRYIRDHLDHWDNTNLRKLLSCT